MNRWLIAHTIDAGRTGQADAWKTQLTEAAHEAGRTDRFFTGKEDFERAERTTPKKELWANWPGSRATEQVNGEDRYTGCLVPINGEDPESEPIGRGTYDILIGFFLTNKPVYAWLTRSQEYVKIGAVAKVESEATGRAAFVDYGRLIVEVENV